MNREPISLYLLRLLMSFSLLILLGMLYWSSLINEERLQQINSSLAELKKSLMHLKPGHQALSGSSSLAETDSSRKRLHINPKLPNLLEEDPFYTKTLPRLLGKDFVPKGIFQDATVGRPNNLHPFSNWSQVSDWQGQCLVSIARPAFGKFEQFTPDMAIKIEARPLPEYSDPDAVEYWVHLREDIFWAPLLPEYFSEQMNLAPIFQQRHRVTASDFVFYFNALSNSHVEEPGAVALRTYYDDLESMRAIDDDTLVVRWKVHSFVDESGQKNYKIKFQAKALTCSLQPLPCFVFQRFADGSKIIEDDRDPGIYRRSSVWAQNFIDHWAKNVIVSCGAWIFTGMTEREIKFERNADYPYPLMALAEGEIIQFKETPEAVWQSFKNQKIDSYTLQPDQLAELSEFLNSKQNQADQNKGNGVSQLSYLPRSFNYIGWNLAKPLFASKKVRQALTMAIDRKRIIEQNLNGMGIEITCPFYRYSSAYDESIKPWPYDLEQARRQLEEEGWFDSDDDGIIDKLIDGKKVAFSFTLTYFVKDNVTRSICEYIATNLKELGIECKLNGVDIADLSAAFDDKNFDAISLGWTFNAPPEDPKQIWYSTGAQEKGSSNAVGFANKEADRIIDELQYESNSAARQKLYHQFDAIIHEEAPYTFLYSPKVTFLYYDYLQNVFIPKDRQDLVPGANVGEPITSAFWLKRE